ncbi:retrovirus-related pol polyprotein from transposon TNT 1-94 [Tanacetum coccineum]
MICKREDHRTSDHEMYTASLKRSENYKAQPYQYASSSKRILKAKAKPFPPCTHYCFNVHRPGGMLAESFQSSKSSIGVKCNTCGSTVHSTTNHNDFDHFKIGSSRKFDAKADDGYFLGYSFVSKAFRFFNTRRQQIEETYHVTFDESMEDIRFTYTSEDEIDIDDSSRYSPDEFVHEDDPSRQYQIDTDISYYVIPYGRPPDLINTKGTHEQNVQNDQMITQPTDSHISNQASTSSHPVPQDIWSRGQHIELVNIIGAPSEGMLTRSMAAKLTAASASECLFADFLSEIEPKKVSEALKYPGWVDAMQEELNQFYRNKVWTLVPLPYGKIAIGSK